METKTETTQPKKHRSPSYPSVDLKTAVQKVALLYNGVKKNPTHVETAIATMEYKPGSSTGIRAVAAMISYGLLEEEGAGLQRTVRLTKPALDLQHLNENDPDRLEILHSMALTPRIFKEIVDYYPGQLPNDLTIEKYLKVTRGFNPDAVRPLIRDFRLTYEYANLDVLGRLSEDKDDSVVDQEALNFHEDASRPERNRQQRRSPLPEPVHQEEIRNVRMNNQGGMRTLTIPLPGERIAYLEVPTKSSGDDFRFMLKYLELMKDAWVNHPNVRAETRTSPSIRFGEAIWHGPETDSPVTVVGYWGELDGTHYVMIEGSETGVPFDQIEYNVV